MPGQDRRRFEIAFERHHRAVFAYSLRRVSNEADAEDVVAETFSVAWRKVDRLPDEDGALAWLLAIARRVIANQRRSGSRRIRLALRLEKQPRSSVGAIPNGPAVEALERLRADDQELLRLLAWEGLSQAEAGVVLGISANAVAIRLYRARRRFREQLTRIEGKGSASIRTVDQVEGRTPDRHNQGKAAS